MMQTENNGSSAGSTVDAAPATAIHADDVSSKMVRLGFHVGGRDFMIVKTKINATQPEAEVMKQVRREYDLALAEARPRYIPPCPFVEPVVQLGILATDWAHNIDMEAGKTCHEVVFSNPEPSPALTAAFYRPNILSSTTPFAENYLHVTTANTAMKAVVVTLKIKKGAVFALVVTALVIAALVGMGVGIGTRSVQVGLACFIGMTAIPSVLLPPLHWMTK